MKVEKQWLVLFLLIFSLSLTINAQGNKIKPSIDLSKWYVMDSLEIDLNNDSKADKIRVYNYNGIDEPDDLLYIMVIYLKVENGYNFFCNANKLLKRPSYSIEMSEGLLAIKQEGQKQDRNKYYLFFRYANKSNKLLLVKSEVIEEIGMSKIDPKSKKVISTGKQVNKISEKVYKEEIDFETVNFDKVFNLK